MQASRSLGLQRLLGFKPQTLGGVWRHVPARDPRPWEKQGWPPRGGVGLSSPPPKRAAPHRRLGRVPGSWRGHCLPVLAPSPG